ncbi:MAG: hypothetical protein ACLR4Z_02660 [Butyricicoccaceae bacterium]
MLLSMEEFRAFRPKKADLCAVRLATRPYDESRAARAAVRGLGSGRGVHRRRGSAR